jgi:hypothetical protein
MPTWHKFIPRAFTLEEISGVFGGIYGYAELWCPWPLKNRALVMRTAAYDALDDPMGAFVVDVSSSEYPGDRSKMPTTPEECPRLSFSSYTVRHTALDLSHAHAPESTIHRHLLRFRRTRMARPERSGFCTAIARTTRCGIASSHPRGGAISTTPSRSRIFRTSSSRSSTKSWPRLSSRSHKV